MIENEGYYHQSDYAVEGETIRWTSAAGTNEGKVRFVHRDLPTADSNISADYYSIQTGPDPMDVHLLNSNMMRQLKITNLSRAEV